MLRGESANKGAVGRRSTEVLPIVIDKAIKHREVEKELKAYHDGLETLVSQRTEELAAEKDLLGITLTSMSDGIIAVDVAGRIILFNEVAEELAGRKFEEVKGKAVNEVLHIVDEQTNKPLESVIDKSLESGTTEYGTQNDAIVSQEGKTCPISASAAPIRKADGTIMGVVLAFRNVTKEREIDRMKTDLVSSVSHELRTPLTSIKAFTATILRDPAMPDETRSQFLKIVDEESNRLGNLIENLLEISRIESSSLQIDLEPVRVPEVVDRILPGLDVLAASKKIELVKDLREGLPPLMGDAGKIQSVMTNLVNNAIKFTPDGGRVTITAEHVGDELVVSVSDTGLGIPREALEKIFNRFYRVGRPGMQIKGTGLGLAIVKRIVQMHGGRIDVVSKPEQGSTFSIHFPLSGAQLPTA